MGAREDLTMDTLVVDYNCSPGTTPKPWQILLVDDDPDCGELLRIWLERKGIEVTLHSGAMAALAEFRQRPHHWDALLTDHAMPGMSGLDLVREVKALRPSLPCIVCTGYGNDLNDNDLSRAGVSTILAKPAEIDKIMEALAREVSGSRTQGSDTVCLLPNAPPAGEQPSAALLDLLPAGVFATDANGVCEYANPFILAATGRSPDAFLGFRWIDALHPADRVLAASGEFPGDISLRGRDGAAEWLRCRVVPRSDAQGQPCGHVFLVNDGDDRDDQQRMETLAHYDPLTGLPNRVLVRDRLRQAISFAKRAPLGVALLLVDVDHFKLVNDTLGHAIGDAALVAIARRLEDCVREADTVSRMGDDEFLLVLTDLHAPASAATVAEKIRQAMAGPIHIDGKELISSVSVGVSIYPDDGTDFDTLLSKADAALYQAKAVGRNACRFYTEQMNQASLHQFAMRTQLHRALELGEFELFYQPVISIADGRFAGAEALIRWRHPVRGLVPPDEFIPTAENSGLIVPIGQWALREACRQAASWIERGLPPMFVAVNVSPVQFRRGDLERHVADALAESGLDSRLLELEITESTLIGDDVTLQTTLNRIGTSGVSFSIDDFGTGYASFGYLKRFDIRKLKIDKSFIGDLLSDRNNSAIVNAIIQMAHGLGLAVVAEGVEDAETLEVIRGYGAQYAQGYYFSRPVPAAQFVEAATALASPSPSL
jgi:diguanylate cyclase (GGDEF)-like protein